MLHRFSRTELLVGAAGLERLRNSSVAIIGLGGVGSFAAEAICRAGVGRITIVDFDDICLTNVNRQLHALDGTVGKAKTQVTAERLRSINPAAEISACREFYAHESSDLLLAGPYDFVLDAIDHFTSKVHLIMQCRTRGIPVISSMGAAMKLDPTLIRVADISQTSICRMARSMRKLLRKEGISDGITVVYSLEEFRQPQTPDAGCGINCICPNRESQQFSCEHRRVVLGSMMTIPAIFGLTMAGVAINRILDGPPTEE
jgi:tRNA A37 threonylcarbamoyladenosine dehydratase